MTSTAPKRCLRVQGSDIVDSEGKIVILKGVSTQSLQDSCPNRTPRLSIEQTATGGHTNMENFITGYPGHEKDMREAMLEVLGPEKYKFFFDKFLEYFFTRQDAKFLCSLGLNCLRIPINHRHFMEDANPSVIKEEGFFLVDRIVDACANEGIYTILDMHTFPGGQNQGWHCDSGIHKALFWDYKDFQDRGVQLWVALAKHYRGNTWVRSRPFPPAPIDCPKQMLTIKVAGYNPMNEPADVSQVRLQAWYKRVEKAIRGVDPDHMLFLDGNTYSMDFTAFQEVFPNCVYSMHDYATMGFPAGDPYVGSQEQKDFLQRQYNRKVEFMKTHSVPVSA